MMGLVDTETRGKMVWSSFSLNMPTELLCAEKPVSWVQSTSSDWSERCRYGFFKRFEQRPFVPVVPVSGKSLYPIKLIPLSRPLAFPTRLLPGSPDTLRYLHCTLPQTRLPPRIESQRECHCTICFPPTSVSSTRRCLGASLQQRPWNLWYCCGNSRLRSVESVERRCGERSRRGPRCWTRWRWFRWTSCRARHAMDTRSNGDGGEDRCESQGEHPNHMRYPRGLKLPLLENTVDPTEGIGYNCSGLDSR
jgi:hypothetical protein